MMYIDPDYAVKQLAFISRKEHSCENCTPERLEERKNSGKRALPCKKCGGYYPGDCSCKDCCCDGCCDNLTIAANQD